MLNSSEETQPDGILPDRRSVLKGIAGIFVMPAIIAIIEGCEAKVDLDLNEHKAEIPEFDFKNLSLEDYSPRQFVPEIESKRLRKISKETAAFAENFFRTNTVPRLSSSKNPAECQTASNDFLNALLDFLAKKDSKIEASFQANKSILLQNIDALFTFINNFLIRDGSMLISDFDPQSQKQIILLVKIKKVQLLIVADKETNKTYKAPIFYIEDEWMPQEKLPENFQGHLGAYNHGNKSIIWDSKSCARLLKNGGSIEDVRKVINDFPEAEEIIEKGGERLVLSHEGTHLLINSKFEIDSALEAQKITEKVEMSVKLRNGKRVEFKSIYTRKAFDELAGMGMELALVDESSINFVRAHFVSLLLEEYMLPENYRLVRDFLKKAISGECENELKTALLKNPDEVREIGEQMYNFAIYLLQMKKK